MATSVRPFLMFQGEARPAIDLYMRAFPDAVLEDLETDDGTGAGAAIRRATLRIAGQRLAVYESPVAHDFGFTPSFSLFVECQDETEIDRLSAMLGEGGSFLMPLGDHGFSRKFAWLADRFGVSWQLNLA